MPEPQTLLLFAASAALIVALPGPTMLYLVARTLEHGRTGGLASVVGVQAGTLAHVLAALAGASALLASSPTAMRLVHAVGAVYLVALGIGRLRAREPDPAAVEIAPLPAGRALFWQGFLLDALNPKTAVFFLAFLPGFVDPAQGSVVLQVAVLGGLFVVIAGAGDALCVLLAARVAQGRAAGGPSRRARRVTGGLLVALGVATALS